MHYHYILVATDGTADMEPVFDHCAYIARLTKATFHVIHELDITAFSARPIEASWEEAYIVLESEADRI